MTQPSAKSRNALTVGEVADRLQLEASAVYDLIRRGELEARKVGRAWRVSTQALDRYLNGRESQYDDEPLSRADRAAIRRGLADIKAGRTITREELNRKCGL